MILERPRLSRHAWLVLYAAFTAAAYFVIELPGDPTFERGRNLLGAFAVDAFLCVFIARGSRLAWFVAAFFHGYLVVVLPLGVAAPLPYGFVLLWLVEIGAFIALLPLRQRTPKPVSPSASSS
jgi:hypothetical protein